VFSSGFSHNIYIAMMCNQVGLGKPSDKDCIGNDIAPGIIASILAVFVLETALFDYEQFPTSLRVYTDYQDPLLMVCFNQR
jgi:hypothetical protein